MRKDLTDYFYNNYNTQLSPQDEQNFQAWIQQLSSSTGRNRTQDMNDYDMRGFFINGGVQNAASGHFPDTYKKPNHPTFSTESIYNGQQGPWGPWQGGQWGQDNSYTPSQQMLQYTHPQEELQQYFRMAEPNSKLIIPSQQ